MSYLFLVSLRVVSIVSEYFVVYLSCVAIVLLSIWYSVCTYHSPVKMTYNRLFGSSNRNIISATGTLLLHALLMQNVQRTHRHRFLTNRPQDMTRRLVRNEMRVLVLQVLQVCPPSILSVLGARHSHELSAALLIFCKTYCTTSC